MANKRKTGTMKKSMLAWIACTSLCLSAQAQTAEELEKYNAMVASKQSFNEMQRGAGMPEMDVPTLEAWLLAEEEARLASASAIPAEDAETRWEKRLEEILPQLCTLVPIGGKSTSPRAIKAGQEKEHLLRVAAEAYLKQPEIERELNEIAARHGVERREENADGEIRVLAGEFDGYPVWLQSYNQVAAAGISADELWPTNSAPWPSSSTGRNLTGTNVVLGMWEVGGGVNTNHQEFSGRVLQCDIPTSLDDHASGVAGTMAAHGNYVSLSGIPSGEIARGVAFDAYVDAYDVDGFGEETTDASAGTANQPGLRLSNHSWGLTPLWDVKVVNNYWENGQWHPYGQPGVVWDAPNSWVEDIRCGMYYPNMADGTGCGQIDGLMSTNAPRHLLVYAAGNNRFWGPGEPVSYFYPYVGYPGYWILVRYPSANDKDWALGDGDTYGFDTVMEPGTAKNVLTVGSVKDVWHDEGGLVYLGYASNSTINVSDFSNCGPTDDGRIKPDVVAVGEADDAIRSYGIVTPKAASNSSYTTDYAGTSFSAPSVTAGIGLCQERRTQLFPDLAPEVDDLLNSSLKAISIHTADDVLNTGPDYLTGWGLFNAVSAVEQVELDAQDGRGTHIKELELSVGETNSWMVYLDGSSFKATIAWSDLPGLPTGYGDDPTPMLVNNLDLWVENEAGTQTFLPWVLDPDLQQERESVRNTPATTGYDNRNNVEQVAIASPAAGYYTIHVVHAGGVTGGQTPGTQQVSILTSGDAPLSPVIAQFDKTPTNGTFVLSVACDPGAYLMVESTTNLVAGGWQTNGTFTAAGNTNSVFVGSTTDTRFWRIRRETGSGQ